MLRIGTVKLSAQPGRPVKKKGATDVSAILVKVRVLDGPASSTHEVSMEPYVSKLKAPKEGGIYLSEAELEAHREKAEECNLARARYIGGLGLAACEKVAKELGLLKKGKKPE